MKINESSKKAIENAIKEAEMNTDAEIVPVIVQSSSDYAEVTFSGSMLFMFIASFIYFLFSKFPNTYLLLTIQFFALLIGYWFFQVSPEIKIFLTSKRKISEKVYQKAQQVFMENGLGRTEDNTGVLILISLMERKIQILADHYISDRVSEDFFDRIVQEILQEVKDDHLTEGMIKGIKQLGQELSRVSPAVKGKNELSNKLIIE